MGKLVTVEIVSASKFSMISRVVSESSAANPAPALSSTDRTLKTRPLPLPLVATCVAAIAYLVLRFVSMWQ